MEDVLREDSYGPLCLDSCLSRACTCRAVRERDVQSPDVRSRERACTCLHRVWLQSVTQLSSVTSCVGLFFLACGALCGVAFAEGLRLPALRARRPPVHTPHALPPPGVHVQRRSPRTLALSPSHSESSRRLSVSVSARASLGVNPSSGLHPRAYPSSGYAR